MAVTPEFEIIISEVMINCAKEEKYKNYLISLQHKKIMMPEKFSPDVDLLAQHYEDYCKNN